MECAEEEVTGPAGWVDKLEALQRAFLQSGGQCPVKDELFDEVGGLL